MSGNWLDLSTNSNLYVQSYINGFLDISGGNILLRNSNLIVNAGDISLNGRLFITGDVSTNSRLFVGGDTSLNGRLFINSDMSLSGRLFINSTALSITGNIASDISFNTRLGTNSLQNTKVINNTGAGYNSGITNITGTNNTFLGSNTNTTGTNFTQSTAVGYNAQITGSNQIVLGTVTETTRCMGDASVNGRLFIGGNTIIGGSTNIAGSLTIQAGKSFTVSSGVTVNGISGGGISSITSDMLSTNTATYGQTWTAITQLSSSAAYQSLSISSTGQYIIACVGGGFVFASNNYGSLFTSISSLSTGSFSSTTISSTGQYQAVTSNPGATYLSTDYGSTFNILSITGITSGAFTEVAISSTGQYQVVTTNPGSIYVSNDYGNTFKRNIFGASTTAAYESLSVSSTGQYMLSYASGINGVVYTSANYGISFIEPKITLPGFITNYFGYLYGTNTTNLSPRGITFDNSGNLYVADSNYHSIYFFPAKNGVYFGQTMNVSIYARTYSIGDVRNMYVIAGTLLSGTGANGITPTTSALSTLYGIAVDSANNIYLSDNTRVRFIPRNSGVYFGQTMTRELIYSIAGTGTQGAGTSGQLATNSALSFVAAICLDSSGNVYISDAGNWRIQFLPKNSGTYFGSSMTENRTYIIAGGKGNSAGASGQLAVNSAIGGAYGIFVDTVGNIYFTDSNYNRVQFISKNGGSYFGSSMSANWVYTIAGNGTAGSLSGVLATSTTTLNNPTGITLDKSGNIYISEKNNARVQFIPVTTGIYHGSLMTANFIYRVVGNGTAGTRTNVLAISTSTLNGPDGLCLDNAGNMYISDTNNFGIKYVSRGYYNNNTQATVNQTAISSTGQYMALGTGGALFISTNYGYSFTESSATGIYANSVSISSTGQYIIAYSTTGSIYLSTNYGETFIVNPSGLLSSVNYKTTAISSSGKYMIAAANPGALYISSPPLVSTTTTNLNGLVTMTDLSMNGNVYTPTIVTSQSSRITETLNYTNFYQNFSAIHTGVFFNAIAMSSTGQYIMALVNGQFSVNVSKNYGKNWNTVTLGTNQLDAFDGGISISGTGQFMFVSSGYPQGSGYISYDFGVTWSYDPWKLGATSQYNKLAMSSNGQYGYMKYRHPTIGYLLAVSNNYLQSGTLSTSFPIGITIQQMSVSNTGQYIAIAGSAKVYFSNNYGATWILISAMLGTTGMNCTAISMSDTGQYILFPTNDSQQGIYLSTNYGASFSVINTTIWATSPAPISTPLGTYFGGGNCSMSATGQYMILYSSLNPHLNYSTNYGETWTFMYQTSILFRNGLSISSDGKYIIDIVGFSANAENSIYLFNIPVSQSTTTTPFTNIEGYVGFTDASGSVSGTDAKALVEINGVGNLTQTYSTSSYTDNYSLYTLGSVLIGQNLNIASDRRIKTNIQDVVDISALSVLRQLKPKRYNYIDKANRGTQSVWGYIAQDVKSILDYAVNTVTDYIPNIYYNITVNGNRLTLPPKTYMITPYDESGNPLPETEYTNPKIPTTNNFTPNEDPEIPIQIKLIDMESKRVIITTISYIQDEQTMIVTDYLGQYQTLFLYGQRVTDFNVLDKNAVFTIATAALQEVDQELQILKAQVQELEEQLVELEQGEP